MARYTYRCKLLLLIVLAFCIVLSGCKRKEPESPFKSDLSKYDSIVTVISTDEVEEPIVDEEAEELKVMSIEIDSSNSIAPTPKQVQTALQNAGYYKGEIDGKIGPKSREAIINFQKDAGLVADGKVGPNTWAKLKEHLSS
jgi:peptidoglycan hydrolase-like protein with peptidoglycan-binding domain